MIPEVEKLKELITKTNNVIKEKYKGVVFELDHAGYLCKSKEDYSDSKTVFTKDGVLIKEISHAGRLLSIFKLNEPIVVNELTLNRIEITEPKPTTKVEVCHWEHIAVKVNDIDKLIEENKNTENEIEKVRQIGNDKFGYFVEDGFRIQFRNNFFGVDGQEQSTVDYKDLYEKEKETKLRLLADMDNEKKRMLKQREEFIKVANFALMNDIFEIIDDLNRFLSNNEKTDSIKMILNKILGILNNYGVIPVDVKIGDRFDPSRMEAITTTKTDSDKDNTIVHIEQLGFKLKEDDKIVRPVRVIVGKA